MDPVQRIEQELRNNETRRREWLQQQQRAVHGLSDSARFFLLGYLAASVSWTEEAWEGWESALQLVQTLEL